MDKVYVKNVSVNYHSVKTETNALKNISFKINDGDFVSIVGPSGCGKSTLLNIIAGLFPPSSGEVFIDSSLVKGVSPKIGYMFQKDNLFQWLNVWDNISLGLKIKKELNAKTTDKIEQLLEKYDLKDFKNHHPNELSGGMRQRVALIRTLVLDPEVLLLDEPFSALDYQTRLNVGSEICEIIKTEGKTAIMVTHDIAEAVSISKRILVLSKRPAELKKDISINLPDISPVKRRECTDFPLYFNSVWKEMDINEG
ncbi:ABC transporter ATP-binding protein [Clostridium felsineum]|uniref:Aliphatic sulfonates import ATP-binding protein SsuB n=1 Tax=Clostridium felsineum TaxID=36839 RepID=A0A1S8L2A5_9CLOT|nr:ABC transporter ATP-binding protein [Clostridium felsineum]MCR3758794.1 ABC transporter ATP-binding protein [Clostridium felsineum]URZ01804.1 Aliphatic sulfonates import ATP-binding protein SsuB [Clostridium felsineum]URZ05349.1 Aliphatic sulfonates import ATP-binding protein SsuB [Clostridium felsineum]URZ10390.1 Aliphatic sulfonates import ATP-binding protein SsuB [Clostridium felsineum]URZ17696.1 Aliphatic sulfonates import ATP-binding protein SsuB [Clostridium felsineum DSM 794]